MAAFSSILMGAALAGTAIQTASAARTAKNQANDQAREMAAAAEATRLQAAEQARGAAQQQEQVAARAKAEAAIKDTAAASTEEDVVVDVAPEAKGGISRKRAKYQAPASASSGSIRI